MEKNSHIPSGRWRVWLFCQIESATLHKFFIVFVLKSATESYIMENKTGDENSLSSMNQLPIAVNFYGKLENTT